MYFCYVFVYFFLSLTRKTHYEVLNLRRNCTDKEIKEAFIQMSKVVSLFWFYLRSSKTSLDGKTKLCIFKFEVFRRLTNILSVYYEPTQTNCLFKLTNMFHPAYLKHKYVYIITLK